MNWIKRREKSYIFENYFSSWARNFGAQRVVSCLKNALELAYTCVCNFKFFSGLYLGPRGRGGMGRGLGKGKEREGRKGREKVGEGKGEVALCCPCLRMSFA
jgi:hypothetical protein